MAQQEIKGRAKYGAAEADGFTPPVAHLTITKLIRQEIPIMPGLGSIGALVDRHIEECADHGEEVFSVTVEFPQRK